MSKTYVSGFPRIGEQRELKKALESYWSQKCDFSEVEKVAKELRARHWNYQKEAKIEFISSNDFSYYDLMLDTIIMLNLIPKRFEGLKDEELYFSMARGNKNAVAMEMTKWFNTNYHFIVPELSSDMKPSLNSCKVISEYKEAKDLGIKTKINLIGPITFLALSKSVDETEPLSLLGDLSDEYVKLLQEISKLDDEVIVQIDEPIFVTNSAGDLSKLIKETYTKLTAAAKNVKIVFMTYFERANEAVSELVKTDVWGIGLDFIYGKKNLNSLKEIANSNKVLFAGVVDGRNIWRANIEKSVDFIKNEILNIVGLERVAIGTSCSLLHVPYTLKYEENLKIKEWLSFGVEKLREVALIAKKLENHNFCEIGISDLANNKLANENRNSSELIHSKVVQERVKSLSKFERDGKFAERIKEQKAALDYGILPTTTIGSFPQTKELRATRNAYKKANISQAEYEKEIKKYIDECVAFQEEVGLDVLVHGEPERNDMVEYFGEQLEGYAFSANGWVQSYGSRCVKPPLLFGDVSRPKPMTVEWISYAQSKTKKLMKGMLTGPVTIMNWSFVRDDIPRSEVVKQLALCICDEISDLQDAGIKIIQVDEAAFKEGYPLRAENIGEYEDFAVKSFKLSVSSAKMQTQIHTHMCYSEFNDIIKTIEAMDADVISIETARSGNELLRIFKKVGYKQEVGPGIYDIHSPRVPSTEEMVKQIKALIEVLPKEQLWINPDCGLKTRGWAEVKPSLINMVEAVKIVRNS